MPKYVNRWQTGNNSLPFSTRKQGNKETNMFDEDDDDFEDEDDEDEDDDDDE